MINSSVVISTENHIQHSKMKYVEIIFVLSRRKLSLVNFVSASEHIIDIFTESLPENIFITFKHKLCVTSFFGLAEQSTFASPAIPHVDGDAPS